MEKLIQTLIIAGMLIVPALSYLDDYHNLNDHSKYPDQERIMEQQRQQDLEYEQKRLNDQIQMETWEDEERQRQVLENKEKLIKEVRRTETESQYSYDPVCLNGGCGY